LWIWFVCLPIAALMIVVTAIPAAIGFIVETFMEKRHEKEISDWNRSGNPRFPNG
jgi:hypothetical protein